MGCGKGARGPAFHNLTDGGHVHYCTIDGYDGCHLMLMGTTDITDYYGSGVIH